MCDARGKREEAQEQSGTLLSMRTNKEEKQSMNYNETSDNKYHVKDHIKNRIKNHTKAT